MSAREILVVHLTDEGAIPVVVPCTLEAMQALVGGPLENVHLLGTLQLVVNEEGALARPKVLPVWWVINGERIHGPSFLTRVGMVDGEIDCVGLDVPEAMQLAILLTRTAGLANSRPWVVEFSATPFGFVARDAN